MKENFDDILKRKWEEKQFPMDASHRSEMIELLEQKKRRGIFPFWWFGGILVVTAVAGFFLLNREDEIRTDLPKQEQQTRETTPADKDAMASNAVPETEALKSSAAANTESSSAIQPSSAISSTPSSTSRPSKAGVKSGSVNPKSNSTNETNSTKLSTTQKNKTAEVIPPADPSNEQPPKPLHQSNPVGNEYFLVDDEDMRSVIIATEPTAVTIVTNETVADEQNNTMTTSEKRTHVTTVFIDPLLIEGIPYGTDAAPGAIKAQTSFKKSLYLFGETGLGMIFASKPDYTSGWKFRAGAGLGFKLSPKVQLSLSLGYLMQDGGFDFERSSTVNQLGFGVRSSFNTLTPERLHFIYTRFGMQYRMHRHLLGLHGGIQYLYGAQGTIVIQSQDQFLPDMTETSSKTWVNTNGLRKLNWTADVSYGYQITPRLSAVAGTDIYFSSITIPDAALAQEGYIWNGSIATLHPFITLNYLIYGR